MLKNINQKEKSNLENKIRLIWIWHFLLLLIPLGLLIISFGFSEYINNLYLYILKPIESLVSNKGDSITQQFTTIAYTFFIIYLSFNIIILNPIINFFNILKNKKEPSEEKLDDVISKDILDKISWKKIQSLLESNNKIEALSLLKKNDLRENISFPNNVSFASVVKLKGYMQVFDTIHDIIQDLLAHHQDQKKPEQEDSDITKANKLLSELIYETKRKYHSIAISLLSKIEKYIIIFFLFIWGSTYAFELTDKFNINFKDFYIFTMGAFVALSSIPVGLIYFHGLKLSGLKKHLNTSHVKLIVFFKNILFYIATFIIIFTLLSMGLFFLSQSGLEYSKALHFLVTLVLPSMELSDIPDSIINHLNTEVVFGLITIKLFVLISFFGLITLAIRHFMEYYVVMYDSTEKSTFTIPPEFAKFFSYLTIAVFSLILVYGTLFINYPNLEQEYKTCKNYTESNYNTFSNCEQVTKKHENEKHPLPQKVESYCDKIFANQDLNLSDCDIGMQLEQNRDRSITNSMISSPTRSMSDYLPLSIFLTLFGVVMMIATKNLLENYFTGLSLKIDTPYEEGERIRIDNGEMLAVQDIGFRAATFYGIRSNAEFVIPHQKLTNSIITNYTRPTLNYREKITIHIPDQKRDPNIPRVAEQILLLAAFIATGVKKPKLAGNSTGNLINKINGYRFYTKHYLAQQEYKDSTTRTSRQSKINKYEEELYIQVKSLLEDIIKINNNNENISKELFIKEILQLLDSASHDKQPLQEEQKNNKSEENRKSKLKLIQKTLASIVSVIYVYEKQENEVLVYDYDEFFIRRKKDILQNKTKKHLEPIAELLVNINYYYFTLAKQLWELKDHTHSTQDKNKIDQASLAILDVPRVTSKHRRDIEQDAFWEVSLMVTVELAEQSDEVIQHINMFVDQLWDIFEIPSICNDGRIIEEKKRNYKYKQRH